MNKKVLTAALLTTVAMTSSATGYAAKNPFKDLPQDHWAYDAVTMLAKDGVIEGDNGYFHGNRTLNRYEMAEIVAKAMANFDKAKPADKGAIRKLKREFASELSDIDDRLTAVEEDVNYLKKTQSSFKWFGDARIRTYINKNNTQFKKMSAPGGLDNDTLAYQKRNSHEISSRLRLGIWAEPIKNVTVQGRLKVENVTDKQDSFGTGAIEESNNKSLGLDRLEFNYKGKNGWSFDIGRMEKSLGQGLVWWENPIDGFAIHKDFGTKATVQAGWGDLTPENWGKGSKKWMPAFFADGAYHLSPATTLTTSYLKAHSDINIDNVTKIDEWGWVHAWKKSQNYNLNQVAVGLNTQLAPKWKLTTEYVHNDVARSSGRVNKEGAWGRLYYGKLDWYKANTWHVFGEYAALGNYAIDSTGWGHHMNFAGGNGYGSDNGGVRGWGLGGSYMLAPQANLELVYYKLKPFDTSFGAYRDMGFAAFSYSF